MSTPACGSCAAAARRRANGIEVQHIWQSADGMEEKQYDSKIEVAAKISRKGGTYVARDVPVV